MSIAFLSCDIWPELTKSVRGARRRCAVADAYFGAGASRLLPLPNGSRLVVDASERAVASGQTCPADLLKLMKRGVAVYNVPNLHAKVFVLGRVAYIGSANVSNRSAALLVEAMIRTNEPGIVRAAREFVQEHCLHQVTPKVLRELAKLYRPPQILEGQRAKRRAKQTSRRPTLPPLLLVQLIDEQYWSKRDQALHDAALDVAKKRRQHPRSFEVDSFRCTGHCAYLPGDVVVQVTSEDSGSVLVSPPGNVLHVRTQQDGK